MSIKAISTEMTNEEIIELFWHRDERVISVTDRKYRAYLFTIAHNIIYDTYYCYECLLDTYLRTWNRIPLTRPSVFSAFLAKITRAENSCTGAPQFCRTKLKFYL